jgi:hypothetical protein
MKRAALAILGFLGGAILGWLATLGAYIVLSSAGAFFDRDGGIAMGFAFTIGPLVGLLAGILGAVWAARRARTRG